MSPQHQQRQYYQSHMELKQSQPIAHFLAELVSTGILAAETLSFHMMKLFTAVISLHSQQLTERYLYFSFN